MHLAAARHLDPIALGSALHLQTDFGDWLLEQLGHEHTVSLSEADKDKVVSRLA